MVFLNGLNQYSTESRTIKQETIEQETLRRVS